MGRKRKSVASAKVWIDLINDLKGKGINVLSKVSNVSRVVKELDGNPLFHRYEASQMRYYVNSYALGLAAGVDGSRSRAYRVGLHAYAAVTAASVVLAEGLNVIDSYSTAKNVVEVVDGDPSSVEHRIALQMFKLEVDALVRTLASLTKALRSSTRPIGRGVIFIDGPLVDPPKPLSYVDPKEYDDYVASRAKVLSRIVSSGFIPVGVVKRVMSRALVQELVEEHNVGQLKGQSIDDWGLMVSYIAMLRVRLCRGTRDYTVIVGPVAVSKYVDEAKKYEKIIGKRVALYFISPRLCGKPREALPVGLEIIDTGMKPIELAALYRAWLLPGSRIVVPVQLAHLKCSLRSREAGKLYRALLERMIAEELRVGHDLDTVVLRLVMPV